MSTIAQDITAARRGAANRATVRLIGRIAREPFFQFVVLGALLFTVSEYLEGRSNLSRIEISRAQVAAIASDYRLQYGASPTAEQLSDLVDQFIKEEVFYHEALRLKLDRDDEIVRRRLVQKLEFLQEDLGIAGDPADADLHAFYQAHAKNYAIPEKLSFSHVFFAVDGSSDDQAKIRAERALGALNATRAVRAPQLGDSFPGLYDYAAVTPTQVRRAFGSSALSDELLNVVPGTWAGPFRSGFGWHVVYVASHEPGGVAAFDDAKDAVKRDYLEAQRALRNAETLETLKKHFVIVRE
jgi:peptidyl-prolyl cis-trans isomerase C